VPADFKGKYRIVVAPALGPFKWTPEEPEWHTIE
jgi:hypothetical protein